MRTVANCPRQAECLPHRSIRQRWGRRFRLPLAFFVVATVAALAQPVAPDSVLLRAMRDELQRSKSLVVANLETPYYLQYGVDDAEMFSISATLGGVLSHRRDRFRAPEIRVRVGSYKFDNTNYVASGANFGTRYDVERFPVEDDYGVLRRFLWLGTDSAYKSAVEAISRKRAALKNLTAGDELNDFAHAEPVKLLLDLPKLTIDENTWIDRTRNLSSIFNRYPAVKNSLLEVSLNVGSYYLVTSEGTEVRRPDGASTIIARAAAQAPDGMLVRDAVVFQSLDPTRLPLQPEIERGLTTLADQVTALAAAPRGEDYNGPVLFEGVAGAQIFAEVLGRNLALTRRPVMEQGRGGRGMGTMPASELEGRQGARILPEGFDVVDDPTQTEWHGRPLFGSYAVDREGVAAKPLRLVEKGVLKQFLLTRQPVRGFEGSNGRARLPGNFGAHQASFGNLFVSAAEPVPPAELKKQLLTMLRSRNKPYGMVVRKMDFPSSAQLDEVRRLLSGAQQGSSMPVSIPILTYRIYPDGREELVRGLRFRSLNVRSLKDIVAAGNDAAAFDYLENGAPFALMGGAGFAAETSVIAPSVLIDDLELHPAQDELPNLPLVPAPALVP